MTAKSIVTLALLAATLGAANAAVIYGPSVIGASPRLSDYGADGAGWRTFDDFVPMLDATVERVSWRGFWLDQFNPQPAAAPAPDAQSWDIAFHADAGGVPGAQLLLQSFNAAAVNQTFLASGVFSGGGTFNVDFYSYEVDLFAPLGLNGGSTYWVSVMARSPSLQPGFAWQGATGGNDSSYQQVLGAGELVIGAQNVARDRAVVLEGTLSVPEPGILSLAGTALLLLTGLRRRHRG